MIIGVLLLTAEPTRVVQETHEALESTVLKERELKQKVDPPLSECRIATN